MRRILFLLLTAPVVFYFSCNTKKTGTPRVLVFTKTAEYRHSSIHNGIAAIIKLGKENGFEVDTTENAETFTDDSLKKYAAVIFLNTTGNVLNFRQEVAFERYIQSGGGFAGVHSATDTEYDWGWYGRLIGGYFNGHPDQQHARFIIKDKDFLATKFFTDTVWERTDELYNFKKLSPDVHVLVAVDEKSYKGGTNGAFHPMSWYHDFDGGRAFYTALGHTEASYTEPTFLKHLLGGIKYAIGNNNEIDYAKAKTQYPPEEERFTKTSLVEGSFYEPTEMTVLPNLDIMVIQRRGEIMLYNHETKKLRQVGFLNCYFKSHTPGVNAEEGLLGLCKDPNFEKNHWVFMYYSPADTSVNRLSRFTFEHDTIDVKSEKVILQLYSQREICCHTGGSIAFGHDGLLYVSAGDNSTPFNEPDAKYVNSGFAPLNDLPGRINYDARRSAGNTNDLRGKIMRIKVKDDGTYEIPEGNLFPKGTDKTRPEIYVMGDRNPYRISVDQKNSYLYWGEVGPDANDDSLETRGPRGYDEVNQARKAGYFGWPLFVGNNYAYRAYDYSTGKSGPAFDPAHPINDSRNNTGLRELPPAQPAFIWYPYAASPDFPEVGTGGRNAMTGPVYYTDMFPKETRLPDYYDGKLFIYDWIRGWIKAVTMLPNGDFDKMEPFMEHIKLSNCIDMEVGPDGKLYLLEYGTGWFVKNPDAGLSRIDYNGGNIAPSITGIHVNKTSGILPFEIKAKVDARDPEKDSLSYIWSLGNGTTKETSSPELAYTFTDAGDYKISVEVKDAKGASSKSNEVEVYAGNLAPVVTVGIAGNKSFFLPGVPVKYAVNVSDNDTSKIDPANLYVAVDYVEGYTETSKPMGHQQGQLTISGKNLVMSLDCKSCHKEADSSVGPAFVLVSKKYSKDPSAVNYLSEKIRKGGAGVWGTTPMAAHPTLSQSDLAQMVGWILSLDSKAEIKKSLPASGSILPAMDKKPGEQMVISASYTDKGGNNIKALTGNTAIALHSNSFFFKGNEELNGFSAHKSKGANLLTLPQGGGWFAIDSTDLTDVKSINIMIGWDSVPGLGFDFELRLDLPAGKMVGKGSMPVPQKGQLKGNVHVMLEPVTDSRYHKLYFIYKPKDPKMDIDADLSGLEFRAN